MITSDCPPTERSAISEVEVKSRVQQWIAGALKACVTRGVRPPVVHTVHGGVRYSVTLVEGDRAWIGYGATEGEAYEIALMEATRTKRYRAVVWCGCGRPYDEKAWEQLPLTHECWVMGDDHLELRRCSCGSHLTRRKDA